MVSLTFIYGLTIILRVLIASASYIIFRIEGQVIDRYKYNDPMKIEYLIINVIVSSVLLYFSSYLDLTGIIITLIAVTSLYLGVVRYPNILVSQKGLYYYGVYVRWNEIVNITIDKNKSVVIDKGTMHNSVVELYGVDSYEDFVERASEYIK